MYSSTLPKTSALDRGGGLAPRPGRLTPRERSGTHCIGGWVRKISPPPGSDPRTVQPVASRCTHSAIPAPGVSGSGGMASRVHKFGVV